MCKKNKPDIEIFVVHTEENQSFLVNTEKIEDAYKMIEDSGYTPLSWDNVFIASGDFKNIENILL